MTQPEGEAMSDARRRPDDEDPFNPTQPVEPDPTPVPAPTPDEPTT